MPRWLRRLYNTIANFVLSGPLRTASDSAVGRNAKHVHNESNKSGKCCKSDKSCKPVKSDNECGSDTDCLGCAPFSCARLDPNSNYYRDNHVEGCICSICRDFNEYNDSSRSTKGQDTGSGVRVSDEPRGVKRTDNTARTNIENITGIPAGTTI